MMMMTMWCSLADMHEMQQKNKAKQNDKEIQFTS